MTTICKRSAGFIQSTLLFCWLIFLLVLLSPILLYKISNNSAFLSYPRLLLPLAAASLLVFWMARVSLKIRLRRKIKAVSQAASRLAKGEMPEAPFLRHEELDSLATTVMRLGQSLQGKISKIEKEKEKLASTLNQMQEGVIAVSRDYEILISNPSVKKILGFQDPAEGRSLLEWTRNPEIDEMMRQAIETRQNATRDIDVGYPEKKSLRISAAATGSRSGICGILVIYDITEIRSLENTRRDFVANVSHELKTPLTSIKGFIETLRAGALSNPEKSENFLQIMAEDADRLSRLIDDLLLISAMESKSKPLNISSVNITKEIEKIAAALEPNLHKKNIKIHIRIPSPLTIAADQDKIHQVFLNLLDNAVKFNKQDGEIIVTGSAQNGRVEIRVQDTGAGIPKEALPRVFERFFRADKARSREEGGTGLGLSIVKHIVEAHQGTITCESTLGKGSVFVLSLPAA